MSPAPRYLSIGLRAPPAFLLEYGRHHGPVLQIRDPQRSVRRGSTGASCRMSRAARVCGSSPAASAAKRRSCPCPDRAAGPTGSAGPRCRPAAAAPWSADRSTEAVPLSSESIAAPIVVAVVGQSGDQLLQTIHRAGELVAVFGQRADHGVEVVDQLLHRLVVVGQRIRERRRLRQQRLQGAALRPGRSAPATR